MAIVTRIRCLSFLLISLFVCSALAYPSLVEEQFVEDESVNIYETVSEAPEETTTVAYSSTVEYETETTENSSSLLDSIYIDSTPFVVVDDGYGVIGDGYSQYEVAGTQWESAQGSNSHVYESSGEEPLTESVVYTEDNVTTTQTPLEDSWSTTQQQNLVESSEKPEASKESSEKPEASKESSEKPEASKESSEKPEASKESSERAESSKEDYTEDWENSKEVNTVELKGNQSSFVSVRADNDNKTSNCTGFAQCFSSADCGGGKSVCLGLFVGTCNCNACVSGLPCTSDAACGGLKNACAKSGFCNCIQAHVTNGFASFGNALLEFCNHKQCTRETAADDCFGLPCNSGRCACEKKN